MSSATMCICGAVQIPATLQCDREGCLLSVPGGYATLAEVQKMKTGQAATVVAGETSESTAKRHVSLPARKKPASVKTADPESQFDTTKAPPHDPKRTVARVGRLDAVRRLLRVICCGVGGDATEQEHSSLEMSRPVTEAVASLSDQAAEVPEQNAQDTTKAQTIETSDCVMSGEKREKKERKEEEALSSEALPRTENQEQSTPLKPSYTQTAVSDVSFPLPAPVSSGPASAHWRLPRSMMSPSQEAARKRTRSEETNQNVRPPKPGYIEGEFYHDEQGRPFIVEYPRTPRAKCSTCGKRAHTAEQCGKWHIKYIPVLGYAKAGGEASSSKTISGPKAARVTAPDMASVAKLTTKTRAVVEERARKIMASATQTQALLAHYEQAHPGPWSRFLARKQAVDAERAIVSDQNLPTENRQAASTRLATAEMVYMNAVMAHERWCESWMGKTLPEGFCPTSEITSDWAEDASWRARSKPQPGSSWLVRTE